MTPGRATGNPEAIAVFRVCKPNRQNGRSPARHLSECCPGPSATPNSSLQPTSDLRGIAVSRLHRHRLIWSPEAEIS
jgi:hypothetical protein